MTPTPADGVPPRVLSGALTYPAHETIQVSETIYRIPFIQARGGLKKELAQQHLRRTVGGQYQRVDGRLRTISVLR